MSIREAVEWKWLARVVVSGRMEGEGGGGVCVRVKVGDSKLNGKRGREG